VFLFAQVKGGPRPVRCGSKRKNLKIIELGRLVIIFVRSVLSVSF